MPGTVETGQDETARCARRGPRSPGFVKAPERGMEADAVTRHIAGQSLLREHSGEPVELADHLEHPRCTPPQCGDHVGVGAVLATKAGAADFARGSNRIK